MSESIVVIGLPSEGLRALTDGLGIPHVESGEIRSLHDRPGGTRAVTRDWMAEQLAGSLAAAGDTRVLMIYHKPWLFLARQLDQSPTVPCTETQLEAFGTDVLGFWRSYHEALLGLRRGQEARCLLLNGDRTPEPAAVSALLAQRFGFPAGADPALTGSGRGPSGLPEESYWQAVERLSPESIELYATLESCAELLGRQPEFGFSRFPPRQGGLIDLLGAELRVRSPQHMQELYLAQILQLEEELARQVEINRQREGSARRVLQRLTGGARRLGKSVASIAALRPLTRRLSQAGRKQELIEQAASLRASGLFDEQWYLRTYPDVARAKLDPVEHYLIYGVAEGRNPSERFHTRWYVSTYSDVARAGINPLLHYIQSGRSEGRRPMRHIVREIIKV